MEAHAKTKRRRILLLSLAAIVVLVVIIILALTRCGGEPEEAAPDESVLNDDGVPLLGYAEGVTVVDDPDALQNAVDDMYAKAAEGNIALEYRNEALSDDGKTFSCYIANATANSYDMYLDVYSDIELTDEIYLSGLIRPGYAFRELELDHALSPGTHTVYVVYTQVEEDLATIHGQVVITMDFIVKT